MIRPIEWLLLKFFDFFSDYRSYEIIKNLDWQVKLSWNHQLGSQLKYSSQRDVFHPPISRSSRLSSPSRARGGRSRKCWQERVTRAFLACVAPCRIFIRSFVFIYIRVLRGPTLFTPVHPPLEPLPLWTDSLNDTRLGTLCHHRRVGKEKN